jgi:multicomponent Na+:H+ antiporter subunit B
MKNILAMAITILFIMFLLIGVAEMPPFGMADNPAHNEVMNKYIEDSMEETGAVNIVSAMILDYRAFDTFIEASVIFTALITVMTVLKEGGTHYED